MDERQHTPEPWHTRTANGKLPVVREIRRPHGEASHYRAVIGAGDSLGGPVVATLDFGYGSVSDRFNAERIVSCVNACEGMADPQATITALQGYSEGVAEALKPNDGYNCQYVSIPVKAWEKVLKAHYAALALVPPPAGKGE